MRIITGDNTGLLKVVDVEKSSILSSFGQQDRDNETNFLSFFGSDNMILSGNNKGELQLNEINDEGAFERLITVTGCAPGEKNALCGLNTINSDRIIVTYDNNRSEIARYNTEEEEFTEFTQIYNANQSNIQRVKLNQQDKKSLLVLAKDINPQIYDIEAQKQVWKARNVKNDWLDLKVPVHDVDGAFFPDSKCIYTVNAFKKMRIYDLRESNVQPTKDIEHDLKFDKTAFKRMELSSCGNFIFVATAAGNLFKFDTRKDFRMVFNFKGSAGSIKDIKVHPTLPYIASVSLDRYLRVYNQDTKELLSKVYLKQRLHSVIFSSELQREEPEEDDQEAQKEKSKKTKIPSLLEDDEEEQEDGNAEETEKQPRVNLKKRSIAVISNSAAYQKQVEHKQKFQNLKKHSIKLQYLEKKMEADKLKLKGLKASSGGEKATAALEQEEEVEIEDKVTKKQHI